MVGTVPAMSSERDPPNERDTVLRTVRGLALRAVVCILLAQLDVTGAVASQAPGTPRTVLGCPPGIGSHPNHPDLVLPTHVCPVAPVRAPVETTLRKINQYTGKQLRIRSRVQTDSNPVELAAPVHPGLPW